MNSEISNIIQKLSLQPHPEGGFYKETYRSNDTCLDGSRNLQTAIYFLLTSDNVSHFHRIKSDEIWYFHAGSPLVVHTLTDEGHTQHLVGNDLLAGQTPQLLVQKNTIFGSSVLEKDSYSLVSCSVAPGFDFADFELFTKADLMKDYPDYEGIIDLLT
jgi:predicted cupin superfamily sugar epimerase